MDTHTVNTICPDCEHASDRSEAFISKMTTNDGKNHLFQYRCTNPKCGNHYCEKHPTKRRTHE